MCKVACVRHLSTGYGMIPFRPYSILLLLIATVILSDFVVYCQFFCIVLNFYLPIIVLCTQVACEHAHYGVARCYTRSCTKLIIIFLYCFPVSSVFAQARPKLCPSKQNLMEVTQAWARNEIPADPTLCMNLNTSTSHTQTAKILTSCWNNHSDHSAEQSTAQCPIAQ